MFTANEIDFRTKLTKHVKFPSLEEAEAFKKLFVEILNHSEEFIVGLLWSLTYDPQGEDSPQRFKTYLEKLSRFTDKQKTVIGNEIRHQFAKAHPEFLEVTEKNLPEYQVLASSINEVTAYVVLQKCRDLGSSLPEFVGQELRHLNLNLDEEVDSNAGVSDKNLTNKEKIVKALQHLNFNLAAAEFLLPHAQKIAALLEAVSKTVGKRDNEPPKHEEAQDNPLEQEEHSTGSELVEHVSPAEMPLTPELVIRYSSELSILFQCLDSLKAKKVDCFYLLQSLPQLKQFLQAVNDLEKLKLNVQEVFEKSSKIKDLLEALKQF